MRAAARRTRLGGPRAPYRHRTCNQDPAAENATICPFQLNVPDEDLAELRHRIDAYKWPYASKFSGAYSHRTIQGGIGHNLPQEAPEAFANTVIEVDPS